MTERPDWGERYHTPQELAQMWGCCVAKIYRMLRAGELKGFKLGRDWRVREDDRLEYEMKNLYVAPKRAQRAAARPAMPMIIR